MSAPDEWTPEELVSLASLPESSVVSLEDRHKDEWLHHLYDELLAQGVSVSAATKWTVEGRRCDERWFNDDSKDRVRLLIFDVTGGLAVFLGVSDGGDQAAEAAWRRATEYATANTAQRRDPIRWEAILCQTPAGRGLRRMGLRLAKPTQVGGLKFDPSGHLLVEDVRSWYPHLGYRPSPWQFWPIHVSGTVSCYDWDEDGVERVAETLRRVVEILTIAWDWPFEVRVGPSPAGTVVAGDEDSAVPGVTALVVPPDSAFRAEVPVDVPPWVENTLVKGPGTTSSSRALSAHYEASLLKAEQPSLALIGFVASIEAMAGSSGKLPRCTECRAVQGSVQRFRDAVAAVLSPVELELLGKAYDRRSRTAHDATLHGAEGVLNMFPVPRLFVADNRTQFEFGTVHLAAKASRELLLARLAL